MNFSVDVKNFNERINKTKSVDVGTNVSYDDLIKNISYSNKEILYNIMKLHNNGEGFSCDITYSSGKFYEVNNSDSYFIPQPKFKFDVAPQFEDVKELDPWGAIPLDDESISSMVIDLPFIISPRDCPSIVNKTKGSNMMYQRFSSYYPVPEMMASYAHWIKESFRVLKDNGILVFKTQATVSGGINIFTPEYSFMEALKCGFYPQDQFFLLAKARMHSPTKMQQQQHARKFTSTFWVFRKGGKKKLDYYLWEKKEPYNKIINQK